VKINANIDLKTQKRFLQEAIEANELELYGICVRNGLDIESLDEKSWAPSAEPQQWELDVVKKLSLLADFKLRLAKLG
jgi:hypothetical protein